MCEKSLEKYECACHNRNKRENGRKREEIRHAQKRLKKTGRNHCAGSIFYAFFPCIKTAASEETKIIRVGIDEDSRAVGNAWKQTPGYMEAYLERLAREGDIGLYICPDAGELYAGEEWFAEGFMQNSSFMETPLIEKRYMLCTPREERKLYFEDFSDFGKARIGVAVCGNGDPNVSWDKKTGEYRGIYIDLLEWMHRKSGTDERAEKQRGQQAGGGLPE